MVNTSPTISNSVKPVHLISSHHGNRSKTNNAMTTLTKTIAISSTSTPNPPTHPIQSHHHHCKSTLGSRLMVQPQQSHRPTRTTPTPLPLHSPAQSHPQSPIPSNWASINPIRTNHQRIIMGAFTCRSTTTFYPVHRPMRCHDPKATSMRTTSILVISIHSHHHHRLQVLFHPVVDRTMLAILLHH